MTEADMRTAIREIPGIAGWWKSDGEATYRRLADRLVASGLAPTDAVAVLAEAFAAAAEEFGG